MTLLHKYQSNSIKIKVTRFYILKNEINKAETEKIACYTRFTRHVVTLVPLEYPLVRQYTGYSGETSDKNFVTCNPKYKKPLELDILFNSKQVSNLSSLANKINHDTFSLLRL
jgi:hypothetical protein